MSHALRTAALTYAHAGNSILPCDRTKRPIGYLLPQVDAHGSWDPFKDRIPSDDEIRSWFKRGHVTALACLQGRISGNSELIDFDNKRPGEAAANRAQWVALVDAMQPGLIDRLAEQTTPSGGYHFRYATDSVQGNHKLAQRPPTEEEQQANPKLRAVTLIETRGEGGYALVDPSPGYHVMRGDFTNPPSITADEQAILHAAAAAINSYCPAPDASDTPRSMSYETTAHDRPGDDFNARGDIAPVLIAEGWKLVHQRGDVSYWRRPGKREGISASLNHIPGAFYVFSSNAAPFEPERKYDPFAVYTLLQHNGDFRLAATALAAEGYGTVYTPAPPHCDTRPDADLNTLDADTLRQQARALAAEIERLRRENDEHKQRERWMRQVLASELHAPEKVTLLAVGPLLALRRDLVSSTKTGSSLPVDYGQVETLTHQSASTLSRTIENLEIAKLWQRAPEPVRHPDGFTYDKMRLIPLPAFDDPALIQIPEGQKPRGGKRPGAGRKPKCATCPPGTPILEKTTTTTTIEHFCKGCGELLGEPETTTLPPTYHTIDTSDQAAWEALATQTIKHETEVVNTSSLIADVPMTSAGRPPEIKHETETGLRNVPSVVQEPPRDPSVPVMRPMNWMQLARYAREREGVLHETE